MSVYSSHIHNVHLLYRNTGRFLTKMRCKKNGNLEFSISLVDTTDINIWVLYQQVCAKNGGSAMNLKAFRNDFAKSPCTACTEADQRVLTQLKNNQDTQYLLLPQGMFEHIQMATGLYGRTEEQHTKTQTIHSARDSFEKCKLNPGLKREKNCL